MSIFTDKIDILLTCASMGLAVRKFYKQKSQNKYMRKLNTISIVVCLFCFAACSKSDSSRITQPPVNNPPLPPPPPATNSLDSGLVAYYPFDGNANDFSGNKFDLIVQGAALTNDRSGLANKAYHFDDSTSIMKVPQFTSADSLATFSVSAWIKTAKEGYIYALSAEPFSPAHESMYVDQDSVTKEFTISCLITEVYASGGSTTTVFENKIPNISNVWTHLVLVQDGSGIYLYVNGVKASYRSQYPPFVAYFAGGGLIGALYDYQTIGHFDGDLDDLRFYKRPLTESEVKKLHDQ